MDRRNQRSPEAARYRKLYTTAAWTHARRAQLVRQPLCERCLVAGKVAAATVVHHRIPHKGDWVLFIDLANHESVCADCHDGPIQSEERRGFSTSVDQAGWPTDPRHPANRAAAMGRSNVAEGG